MDDSDRPTKVRKIDNCSSHDLLPSPPIQTSSTVTSADLSNVQTTATNTSRTTATESVKVRLTDLPSTGQTDLGSNPASTNAPTITAGDPPLSKNQVKKLRRKAEWEAGRERRKVLRKEKTILRRERKRQERSEAAADSQLDQPPNEHAARRPVKLPVTIVIDCDFDDLMRDGERLSLGSQLTRSYSDNRRSAYQTHLAISSFGGKLKERFDTVLEKMHESWRGVRFLECDFVEAAEQAKSWMEPPHRLPTSGPFLQYGDEFTSNDSTLKEQGEVVYLSSEAEETLHELKPFSTYIIGGLVDKNREKGLCYRRATERGIKTAKLPIGSFLDMSSRKVLATNHVNQIMLLWLNYGDWGRAFIEVMPKRKGGQLKTHASEDEQERSEQEVNEQDVNKQDVNGLEINAQELIERNLVESSSSSKPELASSKLDPSSPAALNSSLRSSD